MVLFGPCGFGFSQEAIAELQKLEAQILGEEAHILELEAQVQQIIEHQLATGGPIIALQQFFSMETPKFRGRLTEMGQAVTDQRTFLQETQTAAEGVAHRTQARMS